MVDYRKKYQGLNLMSKIKITTKRVKIRVQFRQQYIRSIQYLIFSYRVVSLVFYFQKDYCTHANSTSHSSLSCTIYAFNEPYRFLTERKFCALTLIYK